MAKWADKLIFEVAFNYAHTHIDAVRCVDDNGDSVGSAMTQLTRREVIAKIRAGVTFCTIFRNGSKWNKGAKVEVILIDGEEFIKTVPDNIKKDNLDNLPEFSSSANLRI